MSHKQSTSPNHKQKTETRERKDACTPAVFWRSEVVPNPGVPFPNDTAQRGKASQLPAHGFLANAQARLRPFRGEWRARRSARPICRLYPAEDSKHRTGSKAGLANLLRKLHAPFTAQKMTFKLASVEILLFAAGFVVDDKAQGDRMCTSNLELAQFLEHRKLGGRDFCRSTVL